MVGIVQPNDFAVFIRKMGYSVGLENTLERFLDFCELYASVPQLKTGNWQNLVHKNWGLKSANIADVFSALGIVTIKPSGIFPGLLGEAGALCVMQLESKEAKRDALRKILVLAVLLADGDIFVNALIAEFNPERTAQLLTKMLHSKRHRLFSYFLGQQEREAIAMVVTIERQKHNKGGGKKALGIQRNENLAEAAKKLGLPVAVDVHAVAEPSSEYLRHVLTPRREWAKSFRFFNEDTGVTDQGWSFLKALASMNSIATSGECDLLPTRVELDRARLSQLETLYDNCPETADYVHLVSSTFGAQNLPQSRPEDGEKLATFTKRLFYDYRELSQDRQMIRNELPYLTAIAVHMAVAEVPNLFDYASWLKNSDLAVYGIKVRSSRVIELGIIVS